jgi:hypothetical protein
MVREPPSTFLARVRPNKGIGPQAHMRGPCGGHEKQLSKFVYGQGAMLQISGCQAFFARSPYKERTCLPSARACQARQLPFRKGFRYGGGAVTGVLS